MKQAIVLLCLVAIVLAASPVFTHVTCLYDIKRGDINKVFKRSFEYYLQKFQVLLLTKQNLMVFGDRKLERFVWERRNKTNTVFVVRELEELKNMWFFSDVQRLRLKRLQEPNYNKKEFPEFALEYYNPIQYSKVYLLQEAQQYDKFNSDFFLWTDAGFNYPYKEDIFYPEDHLVKWFKFTQPQWIFFSYYSNDIFVDFANGSEPYVDGIIKQNVIGSFFGGYSEAARDTRCIFENFLRITLQCQDMYSDETMYTLMLAKYHYLYAISVSTHPNALYGKLGVHSNADRRAEYSRRFRVDFDSQGSVLFTHERTLIRHVAAKIDEPLQLLKEPSQLQLRQHHQNHQFYKILGENNKLFRQILLREAAYLLLLVIVYFLIRSLKNQSARGVRIQDDDIF